MTVKEEVANRFREAREACGFSIEEAALQASYSADRIREIEAGEFRSISDNAVKRLAAAYGIEEESLIPFGAGHWGPHSNGSWSWIPPRRGKPLPRVTQ